ncbi:hypothetical protein PV08_09651 [Exophiala spinifera]|uniref:Uncharacterized protein n=1 Tax=Exophiala spinifera TaxID=91928 RepID=A0A0D2BMH9_9EURO|nr:uncharacterized protein PV08_09651 [Exophiala spinifera]KIW12374.1 hypothetical protein PV08_09651 [Exophiala spinifera]
MLAALSTLRNPLRAVMGCTQDDKGTVGGADSQDETSIHHQPGLSHSQSAATSSNAGETSQNPIDLEGYEIIERPTPTAGSSRPSGRRSRSERVIRSPGALKSVLQQRFFIHRLKSNIIRQQKEMERRLLRYVYTRDPLAFTLFENAAWNWVTGIKAIRPYSKQYNNARVNQLKGWAERLRSSAEKRNEQLSTTFLTTELQHLDLQKMGNHFAELRHMVQFTQELERIMQSWVFEESMELFREWTDSA